MAKPGYIILFPSADIIEPSRIGNFAEDLWRALHPTGLGDVPNEPTAHADREVRVEVSAPRHLSRTLRAIRSLLHRHNLDPHDAVVSRLK